jgi:putative NADPH-quinone reductase
MKILLIQGNPEKQSFNGEIADAYVRGATRAGHEVRRLDLVDLRFNPILTKQIAMGALEPDLQNVQQDILWCEKLVVIYPQWWGSWPALLKGFIDRTLQSGFAFRYHTTGSFWDKLLAGRSAEVISTSDAPWWWVWWQYGNADRRAMTHATLGFCGFSPVLFTRIDRVRFLTMEQRESWLKRVEAKAGQL